MSTEDTGSGPRPGRDDNRLANERSPYLQQHRHNPVDWYPWGEEAFTRARELDRPIFLSIGYSTCHWCHVMERESFENEEIAALLNASFVSIKVDREERPDVDRVYMNAVQVLTGSGGWPLSAFLTPALEPFYAGTYFPPRPRYGQPGFAALLQRLAGAWEDDRAGIHEAAGRITAALRQLARGLPADTDLDVDASLGQAVTSLRYEFDRSHGGFGGAPKFPRPVTLDLLLHADRHAPPGGAAESTPTPREMAMATLRAMWDGGLYDHLGGGFHRYSVDRLWRVPHFEKMLYDQAQLLATTIDAVRLGGDGGDPPLDDLAGGIVDYLLRDLAHPEGGFHSAEDADSALDPEQPAHKLEGAFYLWTTDEVDELLGDAAAAFRRHWGMEPGGNTLHDPHDEFGAGNVLFRADGEAPPRDADLRALLLEARARRPRPHLDDKLVVSWNGMTISALAGAALVLDRPDALDAAARAARYLLRHAWSEADARLHRRVHGGVAGAPGQLDDHAALATALLDLHAADGDPEWLGPAITLTETLLARFGAEQDGALHDSPEDRHLLVRTREAYEGAEPSGNSLAGHLLLRLARTLPGHPAAARWEQVATNIVSAFGEMLRRTPGASPRLLVLADLLRRAPQQVIVHGRPDDPRTRALLAAVAASPPRPDRAVLVVDPERRPQAPSEAVAVVGGLTGDDPPSAFVCHDLRCDLPTADPAAVRRLLTAADAGDPTGV